VQHNSLADSHVGSEGMTNRLPRIVGLDLARCLAIFGMVFVNFRLVMDATSETPIADMLATIFDGRAAALFVVLAGVGVSLLSQKAREQGDVRAVRTVLLKRSALLLITGLLFTPIWPPDILHCYGVYLFAAAWLLAVSDRVLITLAALTLPVAVGLLITLDYAAGWKDFESLEYIDFWTFPGFTRNTFFNGFHPFFPWVAYVFFGMWLGRQRLDHAEVCWRYVAVFGTTAVVTELGSDALIAASISSGGLSAEDAQALFGTAMMPPAMLYMFSAASTATVVICLCRRMEATRSDSRWLVSLVVTGQMALTHYAAHVVVGMSTLMAFRMLENQ